MTSSKGFETNGVKELRILKLVLSKESDIIPLIKVSHHPRIFTERKKSFGANTLENQPSIILGSADRFLEWQRKP